MSSWTSWPIVGAEGPKGDKGDTGNAGLQGMQGPAGTPAKMAHSIIAVTNASGEYTFTFPTAFAQNPTIAATVQSSTADIYDVKITEISTTHCKIKLGRTTATAVTLLGLTILSVPSSVGAQTVHIIACER